MIRRHIYSLSAVTFDCKYVDWKVSAISSNTGMKSPFSECNDVDALLLASIRLQISTPV